VSFLKLNNYAVPIAADSASIQRNRTGRTGRSWDSAYTMSEKYGKRVITATTVPLTYDEAVAVEGLILGRGHSFSFADGLYSSRGLGPNRGYVAEWKPSGGLDGKPYLDTELGDHIAWTMPSIVAGNWCIAAWVDWFGDWQGWVALGNGSTTQTFYRWGTNGSHGGSGGNHNGTPEPVATFTSNFDISTGSSFSVKIIQNQEISDMQIFPYHPTKAMTSSWKDMRSASTYINLFSPLPNLYLSGDCIPDDQIEVFGTINDIDYVQGSVDGTFHDNLITIQFSLEEV